MISLRKIVLPGGLRSTLRLEIGRAAAIFVATIGFALGALAAEDARPNAKTVGLIGPRAASRATTGAAAVSAIAARVEERGNGSRLVFEIYGDSEQALRAVSYPVGKPNRLVIELPEVAFQIDPVVGLPKAKAGGQAQIDGLIKSYRFGLFAPGRSRVVIELARPAKVVRAESVAGTEGARLEVDLAPTDAASFAAAAAAHARDFPVTSAAEVIAPTSAAVGDEKPVVVIDPGHGGVDNGASGKHGELEKAIVFDFARALKEKIEAAGRLRVVLTRNEDVFVALDDRVRFARQSKAALFLSIHADTLAEANVAGATVYTVSGRASDAEAAKTAAKENLADQAAGLDQNHDAEDVGDILMDLTRRETRALSRKFAGAIVSKWKNAGSLNKNPSRSAGFVVLKAYDIPSVLLELGYLSSQTDLSNLTSTQWRDRAASFTAQAIDDYFAAPPRAPVQNQAVAATARPH